MGNKPNLSAGKPEIGKLRLPAVNKLLLENTCFIEDRVASCRISLRCKTVKIASGKSAESAVAETCVRLTFIYIVELYAVIAQNAFKNLRKIEVVKIVFKRTTHEEFHAEIINSFCALFLRIRRKVGSACAHHITNDKSDSLVVLFVRCFLGRNSHEVRELCLNKLFCLLFSKRIVHYMPPKVNKQNLTPIYYTIFNANSTVRSAK